MKKEKAYDELLKENAALQAKNAALKKEVAGLKLENQAVCRENSQLRAQSPLPEHVVLKLPAFICLSSKPATDRFDCLSRDFDNPMLRRCLGYDMGEFHSMGKDCFPKIVMADDMHCITDAIVFFAKHPNDTYLSVCRLRTKEGNPLTTIMASCCYSKHLCGSTREMLTVGIPLDGVLHNEELILEFFKEKARIRNAAKIQCITPAERQVIKQLVNGYCAKQAADNLFVELGTIKSHRNHIYKKLKIHDIVALTRFAIECGLN